jgi:hypothetical protein
MELGGRAFVVASEGTIEWDITLLTLLQGLGLADVVLHPGETHEQLAQRIFRTLTSTPKIFDVLGCVLIPQGVDPFTWSPEMQRETATHLKRLHAKIDKDAINSQIVSMVTSFFVQGLLSIQTFRTSLDPEDVEQLNGATAETTTTGIGL